MRTRQRERFAVQVENFLAHFKSGRKRAKPGDADRSGRVRQPSDLFPSEAETQASEHSRQKRIARASRIDLLDLECGHSDRGLTCGYRASFVAFGDYHRAISVAAANRFRHF